MPYLNLDLDYFQHRKTRRLIGLLGRGAEVLPIKLWNYCGKFHAESGRLADYSGQEIEAIVEWWGKEGEALKAMLNTGFLKLENKCYLVPDWLSHQGHIASFKKRAKDAAFKRWGMDANSNATSNAKSETEQCPNLTIPNQTNQLDIESKFEQFWVQYPKRDGKKLAFKAFTRSIRSEADLGRLAVAMKNYLSSRRVKEGYVKNGSTWFNNWQDWEDYTEEHEQREQSSVERIRAIPTE